MANALSRKLKAQTTWWRAAVVVLFAGVLVAFLSTTSSAQTPTGAGAYAPVAASTPSPSAATGPATVMTKTGAAGTYLTDGTGKTLYLFAADTGGKSVCTGACAAAWPPLITKGKPTAGSGVTGSKLTTFTRSDGTTQVVYAGHPLYFFAGDMTAGSTSGQGINQFGGLWWLVSPAGTAIQK